MKESIVVKHILPLQLHGVEQKMVTGLELRTVETSRPKGEIGTGFWSVQVSPLWTGF